MLYLYYPYLSLFFIIFYVKNEVVESKCIHRMCNYWFKERNEDSWSQWKKKPAEVWILCYQLAVNVTM